MFGFLAVKTFSTRCGHHFITFCSFQIRFYWSMRVFNKRCLYTCSIHDAAGRPEFRILVQEPGQDDLELIGSSAKEVWARILEPLTNLRREHNSVQIYPRYVTGEDLFGLAEPAIVRILENLPGT